MWWWRHFCLTQHWIQVFAIEVQWFPTECLSEIPSFEISGPSRWWGPPRCLPVCSGPWKTPARGLPTARWTWSEKLHRSRSKILRRRETETNMVLNQFKDSSIEAQLSDNVQKYKEMLEFDQICKVSKSKSMEDMKMTFQKSIGRTCCRRNGSHLFNNNNTLPEFLVEVRVRRHQQRWRWGWTGRRGPWRCWTRRPNRNCHRQCGAQPRNWNKSFEIFTSKSWLYFLEKKIIV